MRTNLSIKSLAPDDRPREKMLQKGRTSLSDAELLAILIGSGTREKSAIDLSYELLKQANFNLNEFSKFTVDEICKVKGIGPAKAITLMAAMEIARRRKHDDAPKRKKIVSSSVAYQTALSLFADLRVEEFYILLLNRSNEFMKAELISKGGVSGTFVDPKVIFKKAIDAMASGIILTHNHPSNNTRPSEADIKLTNRLAEFGRLIDIPVLDHLICTDHGYYSFADEGLL
jgi:DNA repair protein RadC